MASSEKKTDTADTVDTADEELQSGRFVDDDPDAKGDVEFDYDSERSPFPEGQSTLLPHAALPSLT